MLKRGPKEKEKVLKRLTEKEIQEQLYSFRAREVVLPKAEPAKSAPVISEEARREPIVKKQTKNPYLWLQIILLSVFIILIWVSIRQVIKVVSSKLDPVYGTRKVASGTVKTQTQAKTGKSSRVLQHKTKTQTKR